MYHQHVRDDFTFAVYVAERTGELCGEVVEVSQASWFIALIFFCLFFLLLRAVGTSLTAVATLIAFSMANAISVYLVGVHLAQVCYYIFQCLYFSVYFQM